MSIAIETPTILDDLGPIALDLILQWATADISATLATNAAELDAAFIQKRAIQGSMRGLANQIEARRLAEAIDDAPIEDRHYVPAHLDIP